jgi:hypothetical protein
VEHHSFLKKIDSFLFKQIDHYQSRQSFQELAEKYNSLDEDLQKFFNQFLSFLVVLGPIFLVLIFAIHNFKVKNKVKVKHQILNSINTYSEKYGKFLDLQGLVYSQGLATSKEEMESRFKSIIGSLNLNGNIQISNFTQSQPFTDLTQTNMDLLFSSFSTKNITKFIDIIINTEKIKIAQVAIEKDETTKMLKGKFHLIHFGRFQ